MAAHDDIPLRYRRYGLSNFAEHQAALDKFFDNDACLTLYLWGLTGSRKTTLAAAVLMHLRRTKGANTRDAGLFLPVYTAVSALRAVTEPHAAERVKAWRKIPWLVLDDLGKHRDTPHIVEQMLHLLHYRHDWGKPGYKTIMTANMDLDELAKRIDPATARRLDEGMIIHMTLPE